MYGSGTGACEVIRKDPVRTSKVDAVRRFLCRRAAFACMLGLFPLLCLGINAQASGCQIYKRKCVKKSLQSKEVIRSIENIHSRSHAVLSSYFFPVKRHLLSQTQETCPVSFPVRRNREELRLVVNRVL
jgi:hypothetical protein